MSGGRARDAPFAAQMLVAQMVLLGGSKRQQRKDHKMAGHADNKKQTAGAKDGARTAHVGERGVTLLGMKHLKLVQVKIGKEGKTTCHFSPSVGGVPKEFLILPEVEWRSADDEAISGALRRYVASLRKKGESVELSVADTGVVRIDLTLDGESRSLWFNARTSDTVVLDVDGNVCRNLREAIQDPSV